MNPIKPSFGVSGGGVNPTPSGMGNNAAGGMSTPAPVSLESQGLNSSPAVDSTWSPSAVPTPGPISSGFSQPAAPAIPVPPAAPAAPQPMMPSNMASGGTMGVPAPSAAPMPAPAPTPRPTPVIPPVPASNAPVPPPPAPSGDVEIRTMQSDIASVKSSGGAEPAPQVFSPASLAGEPVFDPKNAPSLKKKGGTEKIIIFAIIGVVILGALGAAFFLLKDLFIPPATPTPEAPAETAPEVTPPATLPGGEGLPSATVPPAEKTHVSFFTLPADAIEEKTLDAFTVDTFKTVIPSAATLADGSLREIVLKDKTGFVPFSTFISTILTQIVPDTMKVTFEDDFTLFSYKDKGVDLIGFIAKAKPDASPDFLAAMSDIEKSKDLKNLYVSDPGTVGAFKEGTVGTQSIRYASFSKAGYAFDYGWFKDAAGGQYFIVSSSYSGIKEAVKRAGF